MIRDSLKCPRCGDQLKTSSPVDKPFACPSCGTFLLIRVRYGGLLLGVSLALAIVMSYALKLQGILLVASSVVGWLPIYFVIQLFANIAAPPTVEVSAPRDLSLHLGDHHRGVRPPRPE